MSNDKKNLKVCMLSAEVRPYATDGGLADVLAALPAALADTGVDVRVVSPLHRQVRRFPEVVKVMDLPAVQMGGEQFEAALYSDRRQDPPRNFFIENQKFFDRPGVYNDPATGDGYPDNFERFNFFVIAALDAIREIGWKPDILHCHDSQTGLVPAYLKLTRIHDPFYRGTATVFTIHNLAYQTLVDQTKYRLTGLPPDLFYPMGPFEFYGQLNAMKAAICYADLLTTVSPQYAREIQTPELGYGLDDVLRTRKSQLFGILNGIDTREWDPAQDPNIFAPYTADDLAGKKVNKEQLQDACGFAIRDVPLIGMISRLVDQKGIDIFLSARAEITRIDCQWVILGTGMKKYQEALRELAKEHPDRFSVHLEFNNQLAHRIEAGADMFLMPSRYEPCGLNQIYSMRYGTIPIVRHTGGLADTVKDFSSRNGDGTGFKFREYSAGELVKTINRAVEVWRDNGQWNRLIKNAMAEDFSWNRSAREYLDLYRRVSEHS